MWKILVEHFKARLGIYRKWQKKGYLSTTKGEIIESPPEIANQIREDFRLAKLAFRSKLIEEGIFSPPQNGENYNEEEKRQNTAIFGQALIDEKILPSPKNGERYSPQEMIEIVDQVTKRFIEEKVTTEEEALQIKQAFLKKYNGNGQRGYTCCTGTPSCTSSQWCRDNFHPRSYCDTLVFCWLCTLPVCFWMCIFCYPYIECCAEGATTCCEAAEACADDLWSTCVGVHSCCLYISG